MQVNTRKVAYAIVLAALGVVLGFVSIPTGLAKLNPSQAMINVLSAVLLGPWYAVGIAFVISLIRNAMGWGTLLAFPGSMIGALLAGLAWRWTHNLIIAAAGEVIGTGIIGAMVGAAIVAPMLMARPTALTALIIPFLLSSLAGAAIAVVVLYALRRAGYATDFSREAVGEGP
ncbi:MAG: energy coupling factor transporter S component ThiW [Anaerolineae bacterium]